MILSLRHGLSLTVLALLVPTWAGCGAATTGTTHDNGGDTGSGGSSFTSLAFPIGTFTDCTQNTWGPDGNVFLNGGGHEQGATLTLTRSGDTITADWVDFNHHASTFQFDVDAVASASLVSGSLPARGQCVLGPGNLGSFPATWTASSGALTYANGTATIAATGPVSGTSSGCGAQSSTSTVAIVCGGGPVAAVPKPSPPAAPTFPSGVYDCTSQLSTLGGVGSSTESAVSGGNGTLTVTQAGTQVTAAYTGDSYASGVLTFAIATESTATLDEGQTLGVPCGLIAPTGPTPTSSPETLPVAAASLTAAGSTLVLSATGNVASGGCNAAETVNLFCTLRPR